jgi:hypothetical protein
MKSNKVIKQQMDEKIWSTVNSCKATPIHITETDTAGNI